MESILYNRGGHVTPDLRLLITTDMRQEPRAIDTGSHLAPHCGPGQPVLGWSNTTDAALRQGLARRQTVGHALQRLHAFHGLGLGRHLRDCMLRSLALASHSDTS
jgi:hypothetical protein